MTRAEIRKQIKAGWISRRLAAIFMGFDIDVAQLDPYIERGMLDTRKQNGVQMIKADDVLVFADETVDELLDKHWPVNRQKKGSKRQQTLILATREQQDEFNRRWFRIHRHISSFIAEPKEKFDHRELRLMHQLMELARRVNNFELVLTAEKLMDATGLDDEWLPKTRRKLQTRGLINFERNGTTEWVFTLLDPKKEQPFAEMATSSIPPVFPEDGWEDLRESPKNTVPANAGVVR